MTFLWFLNLKTTLCTAAAATAKSPQSCLTLCDPIDGNPSGSPVPGILQARTLEWVAISFSSAWKGKWKWSHLVVSDSATPWTTAYQAPLSMGFSRREYWSGVPLPSLTPCTRSAKYLKHELFAKYLLLLLFSHSVMSDSLQLHGLQHTRLPCPSVSPRVCPLSQWCHPTISSSVTPTPLCPQSFPASGSLPIC